MAHLIDKDAIVAEIEKRKRKNVLTNESAFEEDIDILSFISTLEVKEIDLEKEMSEYFVEHSDEFFSDKYKLFAQHFFELGIKAQKGE